MKEGVFSVWNGQSPVKARPAFFSATYCWTNWTTSVRSRTASTSSCRIRAI